MDERGIRLMNEAAQVSRVGHRQGTFTRGGPPLTPLCTLSSLQAVLEELSDVVLAYGNSDEFSFVLRKQSTLYDRRAR